MSQIGPEQRAGVPASVEDALRSMPIGFVALDREWAITYANDAASSLLRLPDAALIGRALWDVLPDASGSEIERRIRQVASTQERRKAQAHLPSLDVWLEVTVVPVTTGLGVYLRDVTPFGSPTGQPGAVDGDGAGAMQTLRESEERFRDAFDQGLTGMTLASLDGRLIRVNPTFCSLLGYTADELTGMNFHELTHADDLAENIRLEQELIEDRIPGYRLEKRFRHKDGSLVWVAVNVGLARDERGRPLHTVAHMDDVTERKRAEQALRASEQRYRGLVETTHEGVWSMNAVGTTTYVNPRMASMLGYEPHEMIGRAYFDFLDDDTAVEARTGWARRRRGVSDVYERHFVKKDRTPLSTLESASPLMNDEGEFIGALAMVTDITQRELLEQQLRQAQKMEAIGQLAGGVAHDFNNLLTAILGNLELARLTLPNGSDAAADLDEAARAARLAADLTKQLLAFSRQQVLQPRTVDINRVLTDALSLLGRTIGDHLRIKTALWPSACPVLVDPVHMQSVIMNLAVNARDAMPEGGTITFATQLTRRAAPDTTDRLVRGTSTDYAMLIVRDTGSGMSDEVRAHIFEPFFTTKEVGKGTGLGLASVYGTVQQSGGFVEVTSELGAGSEFRVYLPCAPREPTDGRPPVATPATPPAQLGETVLIVEDDASVRALAHRVLVRAGYDVLEACDGAEGLTIARQHGRPLHAVVTDVMMPGIRGPAMVVALRRENPHLAVVYMSGFSDESLEERALAGDEVFIQKPWSGPELAAAVHRARLAMRKHEPR